ncbi:MAG: aminotransferase class V-fold PLP-dependent enzyme [candidate division KSB1 bacterium]|nr:aminotransferase class V-fold PLP-dependent enzyme [candidate division KSB1 bacterium]MDZ7365118.1 aminotransferase class V-fold PLP-dependent enzyme [candidate division KSB1 bacterium]MDZ7404328.1 aminotransferase class V-fold PLP-dependent enzyme [candidate division KSB1 bacterium]
MTNLELSPEAMTRMGEACLRAVVDHIANLPDSPRVNLDNIVEIAKALREPPPETGTDFESLLKFLMEKIIPVSINTAHPAYMGYIPGGGLYPSALAAFLAAATNRYVGAWYAAPAAARLEANVLEWFAELMGYPKTSRGIMTTGGSLANFSAVVAARKHILGDDIAKGTLYCSDQTHHSVMKAAMLAGIPERNLRLLPPDKNYRAIPDRFEAALKADLRKGLKPFLIVGNAGTTNTGAIDPLNELADLSKKYSIWFHIDGAYGGFFNWCDEGKRKLAGIERADSMVLDPHKGLFTPYGCGSLLVKDGERLRRAHLLSADYMQDQFTPEGEINFTEHSPELSRSFRGLQVWLPLKLFGLQAFRDNLAEKLRLTQWMYQRFLEEPAFECLSVPDLSVITFRYRPRRGDIESFNRRLLESIVKSGKLFLSSTLLKGAFVIRVCILSFRTHQAEVEEAFAIVKAAARELEQTSYHATT